MRFLGVFPPLDQTDSNPDRPLSPCTQSRKTGNFTQTCRFKNNNKRSYLYEFWTDDVQNFFYLLKITSHILIKFPWISNFFFKPACFRNFPEIRETRYSRNKGSCATAWLTTKNAGKLVAGYHCSESDSLLTNTAWSQPFFCWCWISLQNWIACVVFPQKSKIN